MVLEAQASGLPAIVSDRGGPQEIVGACDAGLVIDPDEPGELTRAMIRLFEDRALAAEMSARAVAHARRQSWDQLLDCLWRDIGVAEAGGEGDAPARSRQESFAGELELAEPAGARRIA